MSFFVPPFARVRVTSFGVVAWASLVVACSNGSVGGVGGTGGTAAAPTTTTGGGSTGSGAAGTTNAAGTTVSSVAPASGTTSGSGGGSPSNGCGLVAMSGSEERTLDVDGMQRDYAIRIPDPYDPDLPHPLVFVLHGAGATGAGAIGSPLTIDGMVAITVGPTAASSSWSSGVDTPLIDALVTSLSAELCIDETQRFAWGYSSGAFMASHLACARADVFRGVGMIAGGFASPCPAPVPVWITHNQDDMSVPISYGTGSRDAWLANNGCASTSTAIDPAPCVSYDGCAAPVVWCNPATGGHNPPGYTLQGLNGFFSSL